MDRGRAGIVGHCWGGRVAWLGACHNPDYRACAIFYGGRIKLQMGPGTPPGIELAGNIKCPVAGFFGNEDNGPSPEDVDDYDAALTAAGVPHVFHRYDGAGHGFQSFTNKRALSPGSQRRCLAQGSRILRRIPPLNEADIDSVSELQG